MILGTADLAALAKRAPTVERFDADAIELSRIEMMQVISEIATADMESLYPPALHPTLPPLAVWQFIRCLEGTIGAFTMAILRLSCRSGVRPRGFVVAGVIDSPSAAEILTSRFGFPLRLGEVVLRRSYDNTHASVSTDARPTLEVNARDPLPLAPSDVQFTAGMHLATTPKGLRLLQVEPEYRLERAERARPSIERFDAEAWGDRRIRPTLPLAAAIAVGSMVMPRIRYACRPDVLAFEGTERVE